MKLSAILILTIVLHSCVPPKDKVMAIFQEEIVNDSTDTKVEVWKIGKYSVRKVIDSNGTTLDSLPMINGKIHGLRRNLDIELGIEYFTPYLEGVKNGKALSKFISNERLHHMGRFVDGKKYGEWIFYGVDGFLQSVHYYDFLGGQYYYRLYDSLGVVERIEGRGIGSVISSADSVIVDTLFSCRVSVASPPNCVVYLKEDRCLGDSTLSFVKSQTAEQDFIFITTPHSEGYFQRALFWSSVDTISGVQEMDTAFFDAVIIPR